MPGFAVDISQVYYALSAGAIIVSTILTILVLRLKTTFVTKDELKGNTDALTTATATLNAVSARLEHFATRQELNQEATKRRNLQDELIRVQETVKHLPTAAQAFELLRRLEELAGNVRALTERVDGVTETLETEIRAVRELVGQLQNTMALVADLKGHS